MSNVSVEKGTEQVAGTGDQASARIQEFQQEVGKLKVKGGSANPERTGGTWGIVLFVAGLIAGVAVTLLQRGEEAETGDGATLVALNEITATLNSLSLAVLGIILAVVGGILWMRNSLTRYFRYWLTRLIFDNREQTDRLIESIDRLEATLRQRS
jgi:hypothetical protein